MRLATLAIVAAACAVACGSGPALFPYFDASATDSGAGDAFNSGSTCEQHLDCAGGEVCEEGVCRSVNEPVCEPGTGSCDGNVVVDCNAEGSEISRVDCGDEVCIDGEGGAACISADCEDGQVGCIDRATSYLCTDGARELVPCNDVQGCVGGECVDQICEPNSRRCDGNTVIVCDDAGVSEGTVRCDLVPECQEAAAGCLCRGGDCVPLACEPDTTTCDGDNVVRCADDGSGFDVAEVCEPPATCIGGACQEDACDDGMSCVGDTLVTCVDGTASETNCRESESYCDESEGPSCAPWFCEPGSAVCTGDWGARWICNPRGSAATESECPDGEYCSDGICLKRACEPDQRVCDDRQLFVYTSDGSGFELVQTCAGTELCLDGRCLGDEPECDSASDCPAPPGRCEGTTLIRFAGRGSCVSGLCDYSVVEEREDCAETGELCDAASLSCVSGSGDIPCDIFTPCPDDLFCVSSRCRECRTAADCGPDAICTAGACEDCDCPPGLICDAGGGCVDDDPSECASDSECRALAEALGIDLDVVACDPEVGCFERGICGGTMGSECPAGLTCRSVIDPIAGFFGNACTGCEVRDDTTCRSGESCVAVFGLFTPPYCGGGAGLPFP